MMKRDPSKEPRVGDRWKYKGLHKIWEIVEVNDYLIWWKWEDSDSSIPLSTKGMGIEHWPHYANFLGNEKEKGEMNNSTLTTVIMIGKDFKENLTERERAITNPQAGDRWIWGDGVSIEVNAIEPPFYGDTEKRVCYAANSREINSRTMKVWRSFLHAATFVGNFASKSEKRNPKKNPQSGDRWQTTIFYHNNMYDGTTKGITVGSTLMISEVANRESDTFIYGYFTDGTKFICPMKEFEARTQSFKFVE